MVTSSPLNNRKPSHAVAGPVMAATSMPAAAATATATAAAAAADTASKDGAKSALAQKAGNGDGPRGPLGKRLRWDHGLEFMVVDDSAANRCVFMA